MGFNSTFKGLNIAAVGRECQQCLRFTIVYCYFPWIPLRRC